MRGPVPLLCVALLCASGPAFSACTGTVFEDRNADGARSAREPGLAGVAVSDGLQVVRTDSRGRYALTSPAGRSVFVIKPATHALGTLGNARPAHWKPAQGRAIACGDFALRPRENPKGALDVLVFADTQTRTPIDVDYYTRDIVDSVLSDSQALKGARARVADLGITLGDVVGGGATALYPLLDVATARLGTPWLHVAGNHDMEAGPPEDAKSLSAFELHYGPDTFAWEEPQATFVLLDNVVAQPGRAPGYIGGLRESQFGFLEQYLSTGRTDRLLVVALHIPLFESAPGQHAFRNADRARLFALLARFPNVLVLSGHTHTQRHVMHGADSGWAGAQPLHEYNVGAASGAFWSGVKDAAGIPDATMSDGTPNGYARLRVEADGRYALSWHPARLGAGNASFTPAMALHAPRVLRRGAYPAWGVYANVFMGLDDTRVEFRVGQGDWLPMRRVDAPDPRLVIENARDDTADALRGYDRSPEARPSAHLWRGALPTDLELGEHRVEVRAFDRWLGEQRAAIRYRLEDAAP